MRARDLALEVCTGLTELLFAPPGYLFPRLDTGIIAGASFSVLPVNNTLLILKSQLSTHLFLLNGSERGGKRENCTADVSGRNAKGKKCNLLMWNLFLRTADLTNARDE